MVSHRIILGFATRRLPPRAMTPRQLEFFKQQQRELQRSERAIEILQRRLAQREIGHPPVPGYDPAELAGPHDPLRDVFDDPAGHEPIDNHLNYVIDPNHFMPPLPNQHDDQVLAGLRQEQRLDERLIHETRWAWQYAVMLPTFLRCRLETSNWGNCELWNHDFRTTCNCAGRTERDVDLIDLLFRRRVKISFCKTCDPSDLVRLLLMGYIGSSPVRPETAFSVRLMVHHHAMWLRCAVPTKGFCEGLDDFLNSHNPLILTAKNMLPREWREPFTACIDAYRAIQLQIRTLEHQKLQLSELGILAANCPKCFGPPVGVTRPEEPDLIICIDGNFQHRRHAAASVEIPGAQPPRPSMFLDPAAVDDMSRQINRAPIKEGFKDDCTEAHTTANDARGKTYFQSMDESGLIGMACRHDHVLRYINLIQSGEKVHYPLALIKWLLDVLDNNREHSNKVGILYDIGCNLDKTIKKRDLFPEERAANRLKIGTALFHSYAHKWGCQLEYNPRLITGWGKANGEGLERVWFKIAKLIKPNRYATKTRRVVSLDIWTSHQNEIQKDLAVSTMIRHTEKYQAELNQARASLERFARENPMHTIAYFDCQWERQREIQLTAMNVTTKEKRARLTVLIELEEEMIEARNKMAELDAIHAPIRTQQQRDDILNLPGSLATLERKVQSIAEELGNMMLLNARNQDDDRVKAVLTIQVSISLLYEAKFGVLQQAADAETRTGARQQPRNAELKAKKLALLKKKTETYLRHATKFNTRFNPVQRLLEPTFEEVLQMDLLDPFWNDGALNHPQEVWATCKRTKEGIIVFRSKRSSEEEMRSLGREVRQLMLWALEYQDRVDRCKPIEGDGNNRVVEWQSLYSGLAKRACRLWMRWDKGLLNVLHRTAEYVEGSLDMDVNLEERWKGMVARSAELWEEICGLGFHVVLEEDIGEGEVEDGLEGIDEALDRLAVAELADV